MAHPGARHAPWGYTAGALRTPGSRRLPFPESLAFVVVVPAIIDAESSNPGLRDEARRALAGGAQMAWLEMCDLSYEQATYPMQRPGVLVLPGVWAH
jgi:hypothetical protein